MWQAHVRTDARMHCLWKCNCRAILVSDLLQMSCTVLQMSCTSKQRGQVLRPFCKMCQKVATKEHLECRQHRVKAVNLKRQNRCIGKNTKVEAHEVLLQQMLQQNIPAGDQLVMLLQPTPAACPVEEKQVQAGAGVDQPSANARIPATAEKLIENKSMQVIRNDQNEGFIAPSGGSSSSWCLGPSTEFVPGAIGHPGCRFYGQKPPSPPPMVPRCRHRAAAVTRV